MAHYSIKQRTEKYFKRYGFLSFSENLSNKDWKKWMDTARKTGLDTTKIVSKKVVNKTVEVSGEFIGNKIANELWNQNLYMMWIQEMLKKLLFHQKKVKKF